MGCYAERWEHRTSCRMVGNDDGMQSKEDQRGHTPCRIKGNSEGHTIRHALSKEWGYQLQQRGFRASCKMMKNENMSQKGVCRVMNNERVEQGGVESCSYASSVVAPHTGCHLQDRMPLHNFQHKWGTPREFIQNNIRLFQLLFLDQKWNSDPHSPGHENDRIQSKQDMILYY